MTDDRQSYTFAGRTFHWIENRETIKVAALIRRAIDRYEDSEKELKAELLSGQRDIERALRSLELGHSINRCGVLQSTGRNIDQLAAMLSEHASTLRATLQALCTYDRAEDAAE